MAVLTAPFTGRAMSDHDHHGVRAEDLFATDIERRPRDRSEVLHRDRMVIEPEDRVFDRLAVVGEIHRCRRDQNA